MSSEKKRKRSSSDGGDDEVGDDQQLYFKGITAFFVAAGIHPPRRLQIWKQKLRQLGGVLEERWSEHLSHVFAASAEKLTEKFGSSEWADEGKQQKAVSYTWIEDCLKTGKCLPTDSYILHLPSEKPSQASTNSQADQVASLSQASKTADWMQIIKDGSKMGTKVLGVPHDSQQNSMESMEDTGPEISSAGLSEEQLQQVGYTPPDLNAHITGPFSEIKDIYKDALGDDRRSFSYYKALSVLEKVPFRITSVDQIKGLPTLGKSMMDSIQEILSTGKLTKLEHLKMDEKVQVISRFGSVWGIGPTTAQKLYNKGHRTFKDLENDDSLSPPQRLGLMFHDDITKKIPRNEITDMVVIVQKAVTELRPEASTVCGGSYRRGKAKSGDMDFVITHPDGHSHRGLLLELVKKLHDEDFLTEDLRLSLTHTIEGTDHGVDTYFGLCKYPGRSQRHRIDFKVYPLDQYPFGLVQWTGNDVLNRRLRILAEKQGYKLDDHGLYPLLADGHGGKTKSLVSVPCKSEREVFEKLGFPWLEPHERNL